MSATTQTKITHKESEVKDKKSLTIITAINLMQKHGLDDWTFKINQNRSSLGLCRFIKKSIEVSVFNIESNSSGKDLILKINVTNTPTTVFYGCSISHKVFRLIK
jgi:hypothetical protein